MEKIIIKFQRCYNLIPIVGVEIEFYLSSNIDIIEFENLANKYFNSSTILKIKEEKGANQFEIDLPPSNNLIKYINEIKCTKSALTRAALDLNGNINFSPKPFLSDYGSSMHFHINFASNKTAEFSENYLYLAAKGLCYYMLDTLLVFLPCQDDYLRLDKNFMAPTHISFGGNNRTVTVRIPTSYPKRLEYRLASPRTDPYIAIFTILKSIFLAFKNPTKFSNKFTKIYGNASDAQYNLPLLPNSLKKSFELFNLEFYKSEET